MASTAFQVIIGGKVGIVKVFHVEGFGWAVPQRRRVFAAVTVRDSPGYSLFLEGGGDRERYPSFRVPPCKQSPEK